MWNKLTSWLQSAQPIDSEQVTALWPVDMHNHLLPGIDDGVRDMDQVLTCLRQFILWGIRRVITTPHISQDYYPNTPDAIRQAAQKVEEVIAKEGLPIAFSAAAEYLLDEQFQDRLKQKELLSFGVERYVLIETGWATAPLHLDQTIFWMQQKGYVPVLAHPERYRYYQDKIEDLLSLQERGCLFQLNLMSLTGRYGHSTQTFAKELLRHKAISFVGSDLHHPNDLTTLQKSIDSSAFSLLQQQPLLNESLL